MEEMIIELINKIDQMYIFFCQDENKAYDELKLFSSQLQIVAGTLLDTFRNNADTESKEWCDKMNENFTRLSQAIKICNSVEIADIIKFEIKPMIEILL